MIDLILLVLIGLAVFIGLKSYGHLEKTKAENSTEAHKCIYCFAENIINKIKGWIK